MGYKTTDPKENTELQALGHNVIGIRRITETENEYEFDFDKKPEVKEEPTPEPVPEEVPAKKPRGVPFRKKGV